MGQMFESSAMAHLVEEQWNKWLLLTQKKATPAVPEWFPVITISRQRGSGGGLLGQRVAERLGFVLFDSEIVDHVARSAAVDRMIVARLDEQSQRRIRQSAEKAIQRQAFSAESYMAHLTKTILAAGEKGRAVIVGRGAHLILPLERCVRIRTIAPLEIRVKRLCEATGTPREEAERIIADTDRQRSQFIEENFQQSDGDPLLYDLVINTGTISLDTATDLVVQLTEARFPQVRMAATHR